MGDLDALLDSALDGFDDEGSAPAGLGGGLGLPPQASQAAKGGGVASAGKADSEADAAASAAAAVAAASSEAARPAAGAAGGADDAQLDELAKGLEALFGQAADGSEPSEAQQDDLLRTLQQLAEHTRGGDGAGGASGGEGILGGDEADAKALEEMIAALGGVGAPGAGGDGDSPEMAGLMESMMHALLSKDVLQQPMAEIAEKYPVWIAANRGKLSDEEVQKYERQLELVKELLQVYDESPDDMPRVAALMEEMQALGQPPQEIVQELVPGGVQFDSNTGTPLLPDLGAQAGAPPGTCAVM